MINGGDEYWLFVVVSGQDVPYLWWPTVCLADSPSVNGWVNYRCSDQNHGSRTNFTKQNPDVQPFNPSRDGAEIYVYSVKVKGVTCCILLFLAYYCEWKCLRSCSPKTINVFLKTEKNNERDERGCQVESSEATSPKELDIIKSSLAAPNRLCVLFACSSSVH